MKDNTLKNAAYSDQYLKENHKYEALFAEENKTKIEEIVLSDTYRIIETTYKGKVHNCNLHGNSCVLLNEAAEVIHAWRCFDDDAEFHTLIMHQDGSQYLVYRQELYGYTVFDLKNRKEFQYYPQCVLDGKEYFIWTDVDYNSTNNLLAVTGCIWGAPWSNTGR